ncbi:MAG TPA: hypothetical protein VEL76_33485 [Gemmataceae bacterium]|nr:hypothetical protein [Gemmataceae bacterium]
MFLVKDTRHGATYLVFTWNDPRKDGYKGNVIEGVSLDYDMEAVHSWPDGEARPEACVGRKPDKPKHYKVFKYRSDRRAAGYQPVAGTAVVFGSWSDYVKLHPDVDYLVKLDADKWFKHLDDLDEVSRLRRREREQEPDLPAGKSRDEVAAWVAKTHLFIDHGIREVWYLPRGAPPDEIRLLELSDRLAGPEGRTEAIDFGLEVEGASFHLLVADVNSDQLEQIKQDPSQLPPGWSLDGKGVWRRGA